jgi:flagellar basal-body rod modification protein FlgD
MNVQGTHSNIIPMTATSSKATNSTGSSSSSNSTGSSNSTASSSNSQVSQSAFLQLIATELQAQDPTNPLDPSQFLGQLVQFNTLDQVTGIYNILSQGAAASSTTPSSSSSTGSSAGSPSTSPTA